MMLHRAANLKHVCLAICYHRPPTHNLPKCVDEFIDELHWEEKDSAKRDKIPELKLIPEEWDRVKLFQGLLAVGLQFKYLSMPDFVLAC